MGDIGNMADIESAIGSEGSVLGDTTDPKTSFRMLAKMISGQKINLATDELKELHHDMKLVREIVLHLVANRPQIVKAHIHVTHNQCLTQKRKSINDRIVGQTWVSDITTFGDIPPSWFFSLLPSFIGDGPSQALTDDTLSIICKKGPKVMKQIREYLTGTQNV